MNMFNEEDKKNSKTTCIELNQEQIEFMHFLITAIRDKLYNPNYYYSNIEPNKRRRDYSKCNDILVILTRAHNKVD